MAGRRGRGRTVGNLPAEVAGFVGRAHAIRQGRKLLAQARLVTLVGVGGVGKTRLALRLAREVRHAYADGVWLAELADLPPSAGAALVEQTVAGAFGVTDFSAQRPRERLVEHLRGRHCLLVVDNCEHLVEEAGVLIAHLLRTVPDLHVLATSREVLGCPGEQVSHVPPLTVPDDDDPSGAGGGEAVELLRQRAAELGAPLTAEDQHRAGELCRLLDGIPLAIELAAGRLTALSVEQVIARLDDRFELLTGGPRHGPTTHRTLRKVLDWSYELCDERERLLWERISVFVGGFTLEAAEAVCGGHGIDHADVLDSIAGLVRRSLLVVDSAGARTRYRQLDTVRHYGVRALVLRGQHRAFQRRHRDFYEQRAAEAARCWFSVREVELLDWARSELPNLRAAMEYGLAEDDETGDDGTGRDGPERSLRIALSLAGLRIWYFAGWPGEGRAWLERTVERAPAGGPRVTAMATAGWISLCQGDSDEASRLLTRCRDATAGDTDVEPAIEFLDGAYALLVGNDPGSIATFRSVLDALRGAGAPDADLAMIELLLSIAGGFVGEAEDTLVTAQRCLDHALRRESAWQISWARWAMGLAQLRRRDPKRALSFLRESLRDQREIGDHWGPVWGTYAVAWALAAQLTPGTTTADTDTSIAEDVARVLGGGSRLCERAGVRLGGLGPFHTSTTDAISTVQRVLGQERYLRAFEEGRFARATEPEAYHAVLALALGERTPQPATPVGKPEDLRTEQLTTRQREIAALVAAGRGNTEIARALVISERTVETHVRNIFLKRGLRSRQELAVWYAQRYPGASGAE
ncbi:ATP-binding protein [Pseudonocardia spinosispora]|uniref:ATP-binding protein n=1 Tax=Pseudonocardia spinosispora TaxID=103441 RepID=UPI00146FC67C|nr:LuxR C-terminal-related transcriptional regulator [Pseudonocardia spinosispora]